MTEPGDFIDAALQRESSWQRAEEAQARYGPQVRVYGASVGAVRGTVRDALRRYRDLDRDGVTALSSELWAVPVFERRLAAVVLLQSRLAVLDNTDLTRIEGFLRGAHLRELADALAVDVVGPLVAGLQGQPRARAEAVLGRWLQDPDAWLRRAALLAPLREVRAGRGDWDRFRRQARLAQARLAQAGTATAAGRVPAAPEPGERAGGPGASMPGPEDPVAEAVAAVSSAFGRQRKAQRPGHGGA